MPSPFPGMDPYLEHPALWPDVHQSIIFCIRQNLRGQLGQGLYLSIGERIYVELEDRRGFYRDVSVIERPTAAPRQSAGTASVVAADAPAVVLVPLVLEHREVFLELHDASAGHRIVTVIEVLSPANKRAGPGRELYLQKQAEVLASSANLVEIDLHRGGDPTVALPHGSVDRCAYRVVVSRARQRDRREVSLFDLKHRLPRVAIPVIDTRPDVVLDLPTVLTSAYEEADYALRVDYTREATPPLVGEDATWARELLSQAPRTS